MDGFARLLGIGKVNDLNCGTDGSPGSGGLFRYEPVKVIIGIGIINAVFKVVEFRDISGFIVIIELLDNVYTAGNRIGIEGCSGARSGENKNNW